EKDQMEPKTCLAFIVQLMLGVNQYAFLKLIFVALLSYYWLKSSSCHLLIIFIALVNNFTINFETMKKHQDNLFDQK
ncbi:hypothetical protein OFM39_29360, partial [Escherichia coli]|nr:hypothetical protein [Escherichia coli]